MRLLCVAVLYLGLSSVESELRKKRYLVYPEGSSFIASIAHATKMLPVTDAILVITADTSYKLPFDAKVFYDKKRKRKHKLRKKYRQRRELYQQLETVMYLQGLNGTACIFRALCEAQILDAPTPGIDFTKEALHLIFSSPSDYKRPDCSQFLSTCPISLLHPMPQGIYHV